MYGRSTFKIFFEPQHIVLQSPALDLSNKYEAFLFWTGGIFALISIFLSLLIVDFHLFWSFIFIWAFFIMNSLVYSFLPVYYFPGGAYEARGLGVFFLWPLYFGLWIVVIFLKRIIAKKS
jgi:hypothetical protein